MQKDKELKRALAEIEQLKRKNEALLIEQNVKQRKLDDLERENERIKHDSQKKSTLITKLTD